MKKNWRLKNCCDFPVIWTVRFYHTHSVQTMQIKWQTVSTLICSSLLWVYTELPGWSVRQFEPPHDKIHKMTFASSKDSGWSYGNICPGWSVFAVGMNKHWVLSYPLSTLLRLRSDWADAQADLSLRWVHVLLVLSWGNSFRIITATPIFLIFQ